MTDSRVVEWSTRGCVYAAFLVEWKFKSGKSTMDENQAKAFGAMLRQRRQALGLTMRQIEAATGIPNTTISRIETGSFKAPRPDKLARIAQALGMSVGELFAQAGYLVADDLPDYATYLATKHPELPDTVLNRLSREFVELLNQLRFGSPPQPAFEETGHDDGGESS
jgi:transcriptional regulator with XRE-family HTH domain